MKTIIVVVVGLLVIAGAIAGVFALQGSNSQADSHRSTGGDTVEQSSTNNQSAGLQQTDEVVGSGTEAVTGKQVTVNYLGTLENGTKFDSSYDRNQPFTFALGGGQVIKGWDQGVAGMKVGGKRKLVIPPDLAYGAQSPSPSIPPNSTLVFEVELLDVK